MKLFLDEMWSPEIAVQLRRRGYDVAAVQEREELIGQPDTVVFAAAQAEGRAIVTENVGDFRQLATEVLQRGGSYRGLVFTTNRRFPRHDPRTLGRMVVVLEALLSDPTMETAISFEYWL
jgi:hypothetical protein